MSDREFQYTAVMNRIKSVAFLCRTQQELAQFLDVAQSCISDSKRLRTIPSKWLLCLLNK